ESFVIYEAADRIGGTWRDNRYPGCACDVPSHLYSFSFRPNPRWGRKYGEQAEILAYLERVVALHGLAPHLRLGRRLESARFVEASGEWELSLDRGEMTTARVVVGATGGLSTPSVPTLEGLDDFRGKVFHSARWDEDYDLRGKRVAV